MKNDPFVLTINRQLGSGGAYLGQQLAKKLDIPYYDREIITMAAKQLQVFCEDVEYREERVSSFWEELLQSCPVTDVYTPPEIYIPTDSDLLSAETKVIETIAEEQSCIIVGRGSSYILRNKKNHLGVFLHADLGFRQQRVQELYKLSDKEALKMIENSDKERTQHYHRLSNNNWTDSRQYHFCFNTAIINLDSISEILESYINQHFRS